MLTPYGTCCLRHDVTFNHTQNILSYSAISVKRFISGSRAVLLLFTANGGGSWALHFRVPPRSSRGMPSGFGSERKKLQACRTAAKSMGQKDATRYRSNSCLFDP